MLGNKPASLFKRFTSFFIDLILIGVVYYVIYAFVATPISEVNYDYSSKVEYLDKTVANEIVNFGIGYIENDTVNIYETNSYVAKRIEDYKTANPGVEYNEEKLTEDFTKEYLEKYEACLKALNDNKEYSEVLTLVSSINLTNFLLSMLVAEIVFVLIVPLLTKKNQTIGQKLLGLIVITKGDLKIKKSKIVIRFLVIYFLETALIYMLMGDNSIMAAAFLIMVLTLMTPYKQNLHDMISVTKIAEADSAQVFETKEEKEAYDKKRREEKEGV